MNVQTACHPLANPAERRYGPDRRRRNPLLASWRWAFVGRRRRLRRDGDRRGSGALVDVFDTHLLVLALTVFVLSACDAAFTLTLIEHGLAEEANPFMNALLSRDTTLFLSAKLAITGFGVVALVAYSQLHMFGQFPLGRALGWLILIYGLLVGYEIALLSLI